MTRLLPTLLLLGLAAASACGSAARPGAPCAAQQAREAAAAPPGFVYVQGGEFVAGTDDPDADDEARPPSSAFTASFYIGKREVTHREWRRFRPAHRIPEGYGEHPITGVTFEEALAYCRSVGGRLPTDREWEKAARGTDGRRYPWGDVFDPARCNLRSAGGAPPTGCAVRGVRRGIRAAGSHPEGASPYGALNMAGNVWEWVSDYYQGDRERRIIRGGAYGYAERDARTYHRAIEGAGVT